MITHTLIITGNTGPGVVTVAAAAALHAAEQQRRTLLYSLATPPAALAALLGATLGSAPTPVTPHCDALALEPLEELRAAWERGRTQSSHTTIAADELPLLPGLDVFLGLWRLRELAPSYDLVVVDAGPADALLRVLATPDSVRWLTRLLVGLERGPGHSSTSVARALLPTAFIPTESRERAQTFRMELEQVRDELLDPVRTTGCYVLRPDAPALEEARGHVPALHLHGLAVSALLAGPLLPDDLSDTRLAPIVAAQTSVISTAQQLWPAIPLHTFPLHDVNAGQAALREIGALLTSLAPSVAPISYTHDGQPAVVIALPGLAKGALQLTVSGDELIIRIGAYRRHILLPEALRGGNVRATREGERLLVRLR